MCSSDLAPWGDMEEEMRREGLLLYGLESGDPIAEFDIIGFSLGYEMAYTNVLNMLDLAGLALRSASARASFSSFLISVVLPAPRNPEIISIFVIKTAPYFLQKYASIPQQQETTAALPFPIYNTKFHRYVKKPRQPDRYPTILLHGISNRCRECPPLGALHSPHSKRHF